MARWVSLESNQRKDRKQIERTARGLVTENYDLGAATGATLGVDGTAYFSLIGLRSGDFITGVATAISTAGAALTLSKVGLYKTDGTQVAVSAELGTAWQTGGIRNNAFTAGYTVAGDAGFYVAVITKGGTQPTWFRQASSTGNNGAFTGGVGLYGTQAAQTDLPASATISFAGSPINIWLGVY